jgi:homocitrate synthase NifV
MALKRIHDIQVGIDTKKLLQLSRLVAKASNHDVPPWKAVVGENTFAHESGIHAHGVLQNPVTYEPFAPEEVGWERRFVVGKHSGRHLVIDALKQQGVSVGSEETQVILAAARSLSIKLKRGLTVDELIALVSQGRYVHAQR